MVAISQALLSVGLPSYSRLNSRVKPARNDGRREHWRLFRDLRPLQNGQLPNDADTGSARLWQSRTNEILAYLRELCVTPAFEHLLPPATFSLRNVFCQVLEMFLLFSLAEKTLDTLFEHSTRVSLSRAINFAPFVRASFVRRLHLKREEYDPRRKSAIPRMGPL